jgi:hypothetical protein
MGYLSFMLDRILRNKMTVVEMKQFLGDRQIKKNNLLTFGREDDIIQPWLQNFKL